MRWAKFRSIHSAIFILRERFSSFEGACFPCRLEYSSDVGSALPRGFGRFPGIEIPVW